MRSSPVVLLVASAIMTILLLLPSVAPSRAHQAIDPKIMKSIQKAPAGMPSCYDGNGKPTAACIEKGRKLFETGTFGGNGRTCATCHPASNHFTIDVPFIKTLPRTDKLFVHEQVAALRELETPLLRKDGLICENLDGFADDPTARQSCVLRSVIATEGLKFTTAPDFFEGNDTTPAQGATFTPARPVFPLAETLGWGGDGSPGDGSLRNFAIGAVVQHFPKTLMRTPGIDFVLPTEDELNAMEAFQLSLGRQTEMSLSPDPLANNSRFNCTAFNNTAACGANSTFKLQTMDQLKAWLAVKPPLQGTLITFKDQMVERGQILFFGGFPSRPDINGNARDIRSCSGCHVQAGAGSAMAPNSAISGNRSRATGASEDPRSPLCDTAAWGKIFNADGGFGQAAEGFPTTSNTCEISASTIFTPIAGCFKTFTRTPVATTPPLSNPNIPGGSVLADVGNRYAISRKDLCTETASVPDEQVYFKGTSFFSTPSVIEAASTIPLFHNNIVDTVEDGVSFYASDVFNESVSGAGNRMVLGAGTVNEAADQLNIPRDIGAFMRAINSLNNLNIAITYIDSARAAVNKTNEKVRNAKLAFDLVTDAVDVLTPGGPAAKNYLGYVGSYSLFDAAVLTAINSAKSKLTINGNTQAGFNKLTLQQLNSARSEIVAACRAMLTTDAQAACPANL